jgi:hypothetical protein
VCLQMLREIASDDAGRADDEGVWVHVGFFCVDSDQKV